MFEHSLKNAYIGEVIEKSVDLRGKTLADLQALGWNVTSWNGSYTLDSTGLHTASSSNNGVDLYFELPKTLATFSKVKISLTGSGTRNASGSSYGYNSVLTVGVSPAGATDGGTLFGVINTGTQGGVTGISYGNYSTGIGTNGPHSSGGDFELTMEVDLTTGVVNYTLAGAMSHTTSGTLNSTQLNTIKNNKFMDFRCCIYNASNTSTLKTASFTVY